MELNKLISLNFYYSSICIYSCTIYHIIGIELFMPDSSDSYKVAAVYHIDTSDTLVRSRLIKIKREVFLIIILYHYDMDKVLHIFETVLIRRVISDDH